ncbi:hypothetical protein WBJ53_11810 [Spirosoma sp. SC4-14]|uniref:hypothetical protein n=1 Tax=Spirosoma sp. SC4-14 TaxID=3128900 RepID=UPI0030D611A2
MKTLLKGGITAALLFTASLSFAANSVAHSGIIVSTSSTKMVAKPIDVKITKAAPKALYDVCFRCSFYPLIGMMICAQIKCPEQ